MKAILFVALGGMVGAVGRFLSYAVAEKVFGDGFAYGTLVVNVVGCLVIGFLAGWGLILSDTNLHLRLFVMTGMLGSLTTFSTFGWETVQYLQDGRWQLAFLNISLNLLIGVAAVLGGFAAGQALFGKAVS